MEAPVTPYPYSANLSTFTGNSPNGYWSLWAMNDANQDSGLISNGWVLNISTGVPVENDADIEVLVSTAPSQATSGNQLIYYVAITNYGPSIATNVSLSDVLPIGATYVGNTLSGNPSPVNGAINVPLPSLAVGQGLAFELTVVPIELGYITNTISVLAAEPDPNTNNVVATVNLVSPASADVGMTLIGTPNDLFAGMDVTFTLAVSNGGPSEAGGIIATLDLPAGFITNSLSATIGSVTDTNGVIQWTIGTLTPNSPVQTLTVNAAAWALGTQLVEAYVTSSVYDPLKGNNFAGVKIEVNQPSITVVQVGNTYQLTWSAQASNYTLQGAVSLPPVGANSLWNDIPNPPVVNGEYVFTLPGTNGYHFFRLSSQ